VTVYSGWSFSGILVVSAAGLVAVAWAGLAVAARFASARGKRRILVAVLVVAAVALAAITFAACSA
jgi:hypothetical protein